MHARGSVQWSGISRVRSFYGGTYPADPILVTNLFDFGTRGTRRHYDALFCVLFVAAVVFVFVAFVVLVVGIVIFVVVFVFVVVVVVVVCYESSLCSGGSGAKPRRA